ncbi:MAG: sialidase family protein, partial [Mycobacteriales bacterium]
RDHLAGFDALPKHLGAEQVDTTVEPLIAVNPANPLNAVIGFQVGRVDAGGDATNGYAVTFDGGKTWKNGYIPGLTTGRGGTFDRGSDSVLAFGPNNTVYYSSLIFNDVTDNAVQSAIVNNTSTDGGRTWGPVTVVQDDPGGGLNDKNWVVVDHGTETGHHHGRVYVVWDRVAGVIAKYSDDQGKTWVPASPVYTPNVYGSQGIGSFPVVLENGDLFVAFMAEVAPPAVTAQPGDELAEAVSGVSKVTSATFPAAGTIPSGAALPPAVVASVATYTGNPIRHQRAGSLLAADADPKTGRRYVVWEDARFRSDAANDALLSWSDDGIRWSAPVRVNPGKLNDNLDHYNPSVAVHQDGTVDVIWRQRQETASTNVDSYSLDVDTYLARSHDKGLTFGTPLKVDLAPSDTRFGAFSRSGLFQGDYDQVATAGGLTYVVRSESYAPNASVEAPEVPSAKTVHHQTTWVAVIGTAGATAPTKVVPPVRTATAVPPATPPAAAGPSLATTGASTGLAGLAVALVGLGVAVRRRRTA